MPPQIVASPGMPERKAVARRQARVREMLHTLPKDAQAAILDYLTTGDPTFLTGGQNANQQGVVTTAASVTYPNPSNSKCS